MPGRLAETTPAICSIPPRRTHAKLSLELGSKGHLASGT